MKYPALRTKSGFTLLELMVVITIVGLMATVVLAALASSRSSARDVARVQAVKEIQKSLELFRNANNNAYPCSTAMPACANGGAEVYINGSTRNTFFDTAISPYYRAANELTAFAAGWLTNGSIQYRTGGTTASPNRDSYTILLRRERAETVADGSALAAGASCAIRVGPNPNTLDWPVATYPNCF
jgi:prepilin-type N-terminal cleavage/methylation domain-containing protein